jgi:hypothetical protein
MVRQIHLRGNGTQRNNRRTVFSTWAVPRYYKQDSLKQGSSCWLELSAVQFSEVTWSSWLVSGRVPLEVSLWREDKEGGVKWPPAWNLVSWAVSWQELCTGGCEERTWAREAEISHRIAGVLDFIHRPDFNSYKKKEEQTRRFGNWICFRPQVALHFFLPAPTDSTWSQVFTQLSVPDKAVQWVRPAPGRWIKSKTPAILCVIHHRQNPIESTEISPLVEAVARKRRVGVVIDWGH